MGAQGRASLARSLRTQPSNPQSERRDACFTAGMEGKEKTKQGKREGRGEERSAMVLFQSRQRGKNPRKLPTVP